MNKVLKSFSCPHATLCPGCIKQKNTPSAVEDLRLFFASWNISVPYTEGELTAWRSRAKLAVRKNKTGWAVGLFQEGSHEIVDISQCRMHTPALNQALAACKDQLKEMSDKSFYNEATHTGALRYLLLSEETLSSKVSVVFVLNLSEKSEETKLWLKISKALMKNNPTLFHSFWLNFQSEATNTISGKAYTLVEGDTWQWEQIGELQLPFHPLHFRQVNLPLFSLLLKDLEKNIPPLTHIIDLYGGMGAIGFSLSHKAKSVECVEIDPAAQSSFEEAKKKLPFPLQKRMSFHCLSCNDGEIESILRKAETIIVDPPRKGLSVPLMNQISKSHASTLAYISCCSETLLKNLSLLVSKGWQPFFAKAYQFFPMTEHIESLVILKKIS